MFIILFPHSCWDQAVFIQGFKKEVLLGLRLNINPNRVFTVLLEFRWLDLNTQQKPPSARSSRSRLYSVDFQNLPYLREMSTQSNIPLESVRAEDFVEYFLFPGAHSPDNNSIEEDLGTVSDRINQIAAEYCANYIWHKDGFRVAPRFGNAHLLIEHPLDNSGEQAGYIGCEVYWWRAFAV